MRSYPLAQLNPDETTSSSEVLAVSATSSPSSSMNSVSTQTTWDGTSEGKPSQEDLPDHIILDFSRVTFIDGSSAIVFKQVINEYQEIGIGLYIACCSASVFSMMSKGSILEEIPATSFYPSVHDAVLSLFREPPPTVCVPTDWLRG